MAVILLIEPDRILADTYSQALRAAGHRVVAVNGAQAAIAAADRHNPAIVIAELQLVEHSGIEFLYEFRSYADWQATPVLVHSSVPPREFNDSWEILKQELGVTDYLYKPQTSLKQLVQAVSQFAVAP